MSRSHAVRWFGCTIFGCAIACGELASGQASPDANAVSAPDLGVSFVEGSSSQIIVERDGKKYVVDLVSHEIRSADSAGHLVPAAEVQTVAEPAQPATGQSPPSTSEKSKSTVYKPGDDFLFN